MYQVAMITRTIRIIVMEVVVMMNIAVMVLMMTKIIVMMKMIVMVVLMIMKIKSSPEAALFMYFQVGVAAAHCRARLSAGPQLGDAPAAVGMSPWLCSPDAARTALLLLCPAQRHQRRGSGQVGEAGLRSGRLGL